jgi:8-oxo-dGTP pyrophosphatase MutT (NUDIX family)
MNATTFLDQLKRSLAQGLPGEAAHQHLMPLKRPLSSAAKAQSTTYRESAVGIVLHPKNDSIHCILIRRPSYDGAHSGQISFPGGKKESDDENLEETARRECLEEIGLPHHHSTLIHPLTEVFIPVSNFSVQPYIFFCEVLPDLIPDEREVAEIISFDLVELTRRNEIPRTSIKINSSLTMKDVPYFDIDGHIVWGATAMMLGEMKVLLERM